jgi:hypothetical protein
MIYEHAREAQPNVKFADLTLIGSVPELGSSLAPVEQALARGEHATIFLDSYEECPLRDSTGRAIAEVIGSMHRERLRLRLACRSVSWTGDLASRLEILWGREVTRAVELMRLTRDDVLLALERLQGIDTDPGALLLQLEQRDLVPLLTTPVTLLMIRGLLQAGEQVANLSRAELYRRGMLRLARPTRRQALTSLSDDERIAIARRIAAVSLFCNRHVIYDEPDVGGKPPNEVSVAELLGGVEPTGEPPRDGHVAVTEPHVRDVLATSGLFNLRSAGRLGWAHASYAEYLASEYVRVRNVPYQALAGLLRLGTGQGPLLPSLRGVIGWILPNEKRVLQELIEREPTTVLRSDVQDLSEEHRAKIANSLLNKAREDVLDLRSGEVFAQLQRLTYPGLSAQLLKRITDVRAEPRERSFAIRIALACGLHDLAGPLAKVALEAGDIRVRIDAARAVQMPIGARRVSTWRRRPP